MIHFGINLLKFLRVDPSKILSGLRRLVGMAIPQGGK